MKARWVEIRTEFTLGPEVDYECSNCGKTPHWTVTPKEILPPFCPWCGSEMEVEDEDQT